MWDVDRLEHLARSSSGRTGSTSTSASGPPLVAVHGDDEFDYLAVVPDLLRRSVCRAWQPYSRAMCDPSSARGKVNKGIRTTVQSKPEKFLAFNNGITATATG